MEIAINIKQAYTEIDSFIEMLDEKEKNKIPKKLRNIFKENKDVNYNVNIIELIENKNLKKETLAIIAFLNLKYWLESETEKQRLIKVYHENERKYQVELMKKYNPDNIFKNETKPKVIEQETISNTLNENITQNTELTEIKENFFQKIMRRIKTIFSKK